MPTKVELELENRDLKRKLEENKQNLEEKEKNLEEKERKLEEKEEEISLAKNKLIKLDSLMQKVKEKIECPVCLDIPRKSPVPVCPNGHFVCGKCKTNSCPSCRVNMGQGKSLLAATIVENIDHKCSFVDCEESFCHGDLVEHENICPHRTVICPRCSISVSLAKLEDHLANTPLCCSQIMDSLETHWILCDYTCGASKVFRDHATWPVNLCRISGKMFVIYPFKDNGLYYFVILMLDSEAECLKYKFEIIVHEKGSDATKLGNIIKFQGCPLSVDSTYEERKIYVCCQQSVYVKYFQSFFSQNVQLVV